MEKAQDLQPQILVHPSKESNLFESTNNITNQVIKYSRAKDSKRWMRIALYTLLVVSGQSASILLSRFYFNKGGKSKWVATLVQVVGFPILAPYYFAISTSTKKHASHALDKTRPSLRVTALTYTSLGLLLSANNIMYSVGLFHLPVSIFSLICVSQLGFNALSSFFLNSQKFTPYIVNALFLLTISSSMVLFNTNVENTVIGVSNDEYRIGILCAVGSSAGFGLMLSLTQLSIEKVMKLDSFQTVLELIIFQSLVATLVATLGLFVGGEWKGLEREMDEFENGKSSYFTVLGSAVVAWQVFTLGTTGLIFEVSSLFSNVISVLGLPFVSVLAVFFFHDTMDGLKATAMLLALWGFASYLYQHYLDDSKLDAEMDSSAEDQRVKEISMVPLLKEISD